MGRALPGHATSEESRKKMSLAKKGRPLSLEHRKNLSAAHSKEKNANWRNGATRDAYKFKSSISAKLREWRKIVMGRSGGKCLECGAGVDLHAHHIIAMVDMREVALEGWNGVCLCKKCHHKTETWGGMTKTRLDKFMGLKTYIATIPHKWQEYPTAGNWKFTSNGCLIVLVSETGNDDYNILIAQHEYTEAILCQKAGIKEEDITLFDKRFERANKEGEPGDDPDAPYYKQHHIATKFEKMFCKELGLKWKDYSTAIEALFKENESCHQQTQS